MRRSWKLAVLYMEVGLSPSGEPGSRKGSFASSVRVVIALLSVPIKLGRFHVGAAATTPPADSDTDDTLRGDEDADEFDVGEFFRIIHELSSEFTVDR